MIEKLKSFWLAIPIVGAVLLYSSNILAMWNSPAEIDKTQKAVTDLAAQLQTYTASEEKANEQRDKLISLMATELMEDEHGTDSTVN